MKMLFTLLTLLLSSFASAIGNGPTVPWPTSIERQNIVIEDLAGSWVAYGDNSVWHIRIKYEEYISNQWASVEIRSNALFTTKAVGWLQLDERLFWGEIVMDKNHKMPLVIFKDAEGSKLRLGKTSGRYLDLKLFKR